MRWSRGVVFKGEVNGEDEWRRKSPSFDPARGRSVSPPFRLHSKFTDHRLLAATSVEKNWDREKIRRENPEFRANLMRAILRRERRIEKFHPGAKNIDRDGEKLCLPWEKSFRDISLCIFSVRCPYFQRIFFSPWLSKENEEKKKKRKIYRRKERETRFLIKARYDPSAVRGTSVHQNLPHELRQAGQINRDIYMRAEQSRNF